MPGRFVAQAVKPTPARMVWLTAASTKMARKKSGNGKGDCHKDLKYEGEFCQQLAFSGATSAILRRAEGDLFVII